MALSQAILGDSAQVLAVTLELFGRRLTAREEGKVVGDFRRETIKQLICYQQIK